MEGKERWTVEDFENGISKAINGQGQIVYPTRVVDSLLNRQGIRFAYVRYNGLNDTTSFVDNNGKLLPDHETVLDLFKIQENG